MVLFEFGKSLVDFIEGTHLVQRETYDTGLLCKSLEDGLADPPYCVRYEFESSCLIEFFCCLDQSEVTFVDKVRKTESLVLILFRNRHYESQVCTGEFLQSSLVTFTDALGKFHFLLDRDKFLAADLLKVLVEGGAFPVGD